jgi:hypothetical protein
MKEAGTASHAPLAKCPHTRSELNFPQLPTVIESKMSAASMIAAYCSTPTTPANNLKNKMT